MRVSVTTDDGEVVEVYDMPEINDRTDALREAAERSDVGVTAWDEDR